jgi:hypothetical protein
MFIPEKARIFDKEEYDKVKDPKAESTDNNCTKNSEKKKPSEHITVIVNKYKSKSKENFGKQKSSNLKQKMDIDYNAIPVSNNNLNAEDILGNENHFDTLLKNKNKKEKENSPDRKTYEIAKTNPEQKNLSTTTTTGTKHSKFSKDLLRIKVCRKSMKTIYIFLNNRCKREGLHLKKVKINELYGNVRKRRWFLRRKIKVILASNPYNKRVIKQMIEKNDIIFKIFVEYEFEDFYTKLFLNKNNKKKFLKLNDINDTSLHLTQFKTFEEHLTEEKNNSTEEYVVRLSKIGYDFIKDIKGNGDLYLRIAKKRIKTKSYSIRYKINYQKE